MTRPRLVTRYPTSFLTACETALARGSLRIPSAKPSQLRAQFYGFLAALRRDGKSELADSIALFLEDDALILRPRDKTPAALEVDAALNALPDKPSEDQEIEDIFNRLPT